MENNKQGESKISMPVAIIVMGLLIMFGIIISKGMGNKTVSDNTVKSDTTTATTKAVIAPVSSADHIRGDISTAKVLIIEFSDTECPFCKMFHPALKQAMEKYPGQIAWVYRHFPLEQLHSKARNEARATECVNKLKGNDAFWQYVDMIYENTPGNNGLDPNLLTTYAVKVGVDKTAFSKCMVDDQAEFNKVIDANLADGQLAGVTGTPHSVIITKDQTQIPIVGADPDLLNSTLKSILE